MSEYRATKQQVYTRGIAPDKFLDTIIAWAKEVREHSNMILFGTNNFPDIYSLVHPMLAPWKGEPGSPEFLLHRCAVMLEVMRCHAGFESSWNWNEGVDRSNPKSINDPERAESGIFQVSYDSTRLHPDLKTMAIKYDFDSTGKFIWVMKNNHDIALSYYALLVRYNIRWAGPLRDKKIFPYLRRDAVTEFETFLSK